MNNTDVENIVAFIRILKDQTAGRWFAVKEEVSNEGYTIKEIAESLGLLTRQIDHDPLLNEDD